MQDYTEPVISIPMFKEIAGTIKGEQLNKARTNK
jgi:hypothetical protein